MSKLGVKTVERIKATDKGFVSTCTGSSGELLKVAPIAAALLLK
jgi:hypothetical protein